MKFKHLIIALLAASAGSAFAADTYNIDPLHTYPSFEADHHGLSFWRGKFNKTSGTVTLDRAAKTGSLDIVIDTTSIDFGLPAMNSEAKKPIMFNVEKFPTATYKSKSFKFDGDKPVSVEGELTLLGVTKPVALTIKQFKCALDPRLKREVCGADASAEFKRTDFGLSYGGPSFAPEVRLAIQVEAIKAD
ncbi:YceI family protein [Janthinobacterium agaricidamnosum]|uniref:YceI-like domain protein n=1 Tax=Janthinobacterium agaricidamnosum NBRC 102515 = DSM 9628 TaxID=1349767 RepID=W0UZE7_9BURK|nr:YceI family protein [Janthinobacterium agaricidamnosum]CDG80991.1 yceI-like domain protein [Janthinobacterium agaricidamnosum NBRC 102515 = DSM 9628]